MSPRASSGSDRLDPGGRGTRFAPWRPPGVFRGWGVGSSLMSGAAATEPLLERSEELGRSSRRLPRPAKGGALLGAARSAAAESGMRVLRSRGTELERDFAFGVVRQLFEPALAEASTVERADLLQAAAGEVAALLGLPGASPANGRHSSGVDPSFAILHGLYWSCANTATDVHPPDRPQRGLLRAFRRRVPGARRQGPSGTSCPPCWRRRLPFPPSASAASDRRAS